jgi:hypothetical protein
MTPSARDIAKPRKKRAPVTGELIGVRLQPDFLRRLDGWIVGLDEPLPSRPEAIRRLVEIGLAAAPRKDDRARRQAAKAEKMAAAVVDRELAKKDERGHVKARRRKALLSGQDDLAGEKTRRNRP